MDDLPVPALPEPAAAALLCITLNGKFRNSIRYAVKENAALMNLDLDSFTMGLLFKMK